VLTEFVSVAETVEVPAVSDRLAAVSVAGPTVVVCADRVRVSVSVTVSVRVGEPVGVKRKTQLRKLWSKKTVSIQSSTCSLVMTNISRQNLGMLEAFLEIY
jgi:hypothetical protein